MSTLNFLKEYGVTLLSIIVTLLALLLSYFKAKKTGNSKGMVALLEMIPSLVITAESLFGAGKGSAKLDYVLTQLRLYALQNNLNVNIEDLTAQVNSVVETTNNVNVNKLQPSCKDSEDGNSVEINEHITQDTINI